MKLCRTEASGCRGSFSAPFWKLYRCYCPTFAGHMGHVWQKDRKLFLLGMNWKYPAGARIPFLIRVAGRKSQGSFLLLRQHLGGVIKSSYPEKIRLFKNEIKIMLFFWVFLILPFKFVNLGVLFCPVPAAEGGSGCVWCAVITQA